MKGHYNHKLLYKRANEQSDAAIEEVENVIQTLKKCEAELSAAKDVKKREQVRYTIFQNRENLIAAVTNKGQPRMRPLSAADRGSQETGKCYPRTHLRPRTHSWKHRNPFIARVRLDHGPRLPGSSFDLHEMYDRAPNFSCVLHADEEVDEEMGQREIEQSAQKPTTKPAFITIFKKVVEELQAEQATCLSGPVWKPINPVVRTTTSQHCLLCHAAFRTTPSQQRRQLHSNAETTAFRNLCPRPENLYGVQKEPTKPRRMNALSTPIERTYDAQESPLENVMDDLANTAEPILATKCGIVLEHLRLSLVSRRPQNQSLTALDAAWIMNHLAKSKLQIDAYHTLSGEACKVPDPRIYPFLRDLARIYRQKLRQLETDTMGLDTTQKNKKEILEEFKSVLTELNSVAETVVHMPYGNEPHRPLWIGLGRYMDDEDQELQQGGFDEIDMDVEFGEEVQEEMQEEVQGEVREEANIGVQAEDGSDITKSALERTMAIVNNTPNQSLAFRCGIVLEQLRLGLHMHGNKGLNSQEAAWIINHLAKSELQIDAYHHVYKPCKLEDKRVNDFVREFRSIYERIRDQVVSENPNALAMRFRNVVPDLRALPELKVHPKYRGIPPAEPHCSLWFNFLSL
ncbi:uncharacterized protein E0L32_006522 [Thyridium curvatum]|uniref:Uncharacterized protein n=1 Tax=Thyridium curvatum TaxID=1093900 RepID=A0A507B205_9PEZI|nr:uncharacterized protein E0L32_006522 [Thyridium curvatum]TPX13096.1 hypothetical protein E0L32_006522 [Thyridium curvatum]